MNVGFKGVMRTIGPVMSAATASWFILDKPAPALSPKSMVASRHRKRQRPMFRTRCPSSSRRSWSNVSRRDAISSYVTSRRWLRGCWVRIPRAGWRCCATPSCIEALRDWAELALDVLMEPDLGIIGTFYLLSPCRHLIFAKGRCSSPSYSTTKSF